jgi:phage repressor protein C with HTH and peptisase S24 domain
MLSHGQVWTAIDKLAAQHGMSPSALAKRAGLDPTTFNRSKRITNDGRPRWPSTESIAKVLAATGAGVDDFMAYLSSEQAPLRAVPVIGFAKAGAGGYFDDAGFPAGSGWEHIPFPALSDEHAYALEVAGDSMEPLYRDGDLIVVSPGASVRRGDRVVVKTKAGEVLAKQLKRRTAEAVELRSLNPDHPDRSIAASDVLWVAHIVWASQ